MGEGIMAIIGILTLIIGLLWILMPFLIMGTNNRLDKLVEAKRAEINNQEEVMGNQKKILKHLNAINQREERKDNP